MKYFTSALLTLILLCSSLYLSAQNKKTDTGSEIIDDSIVVPESMNEQLPKLLKNWQISFKNSEHKYTQRGNMHVADSVYAKRLYSQPSIMELSFNQVIKKYIEMYADRRRDLVSYMLSVGDYYFPMFEQFLEKYGLPLELKYLPVIESALNPVASSRAKAVGLWQFMLPTGKMYNLEINSLIDERCDPYKSSEAAARYLKDLYSIYSDWNLAIAAYNCGPGNVNKAIARSGGQRDYWKIYANLPRETRGYVPAFIAANYIMTYHKEHNIFPAESYQSINGVDTIMVKSQIHFSQIAEVLNIPIDELRRLNPQFRKDIIPGNFRPYSLVLPTDKMMDFVNKKDEIKDYKKDELFTHRITTDTYINTLPDNDSGRGTASNIYYKVRKKDTLSKIAQKHGVSVANLRAWNGLKNRKNTIIAGKTIIVGKRKKVVQVAPPKKQEQNNIAKTSDSTAKSNEGESFIFNYFKEKNNRSSNDTVRDNNK